MAARLSSLLSSSRRKSGSMNVCVGDPAGAPSPVLGARVHGIPAFAGIGALGSSPSRSPPVRRQGGRPMSAAWRRSRRGRSRTARVELLNALQANPDDRAARMHAGAGRSRARRRQSRRKRRSCAPARPARAPPTPRHSRPRQIAPGRRPRRAGRGARPPTPANAAYAARIAGRAYMALGDGGKPRPRSTARSRSAPARRATSGPTSRDSAAGAATSPARSRPPTAPSPPAPRNVDALVLRGILTRSQYGLAAALPWFDRALGIDGGNVERPDRARRDLWRMGRMSDMLADAREAHRLTGGNATAYYLEAVLAARARNFDSRGGLMRAHRRRLRRQPGRAAAARGDRFPDRQWRAGRAPPRRPRRRPARQSPRPPPARRRAVADGRCRRGRDRDAAPDRRPARCRLPTA